MILDNNLVFANALTLTTNADTISSVYDLATGTMLTGSTYTAATSLNLVWGNATYFGEDMGIGQGMAWPQIFVTATTAITTSNSATCTVQVQGAADAGGTTISGLTWTVYEQSDAITAAQALINTMIYKTQWPHRKVAAVLPRFISLNFHISASTQFTAGAVSAYVAESREDWDAKFYPSNFIVAA